MTHGVRKVSSQGSLAAQALVRASYREPLSTFATNVQGTANLLDALRLAAAGDGHVGAG